VSTVDLPAADIADLCDKAAEIINANGFNKRYLYDTRQAANGTPVEDCRVDIIGALNTAAHGTPCYAGSPAVFAAEQVITARIAAPSVVVWNDTKGHNADGAIALLKRIAAELRTEQAS
jgi:hypothetical protein